MTIAQCGCTASVCSYVVTRDSITAGTASIQTYTIHTITRDDVTLSIGAATDVVIGSIIDKNPMVSISQRGRTTWVSANVITRAF